MPPCPLPMNRYPQWKDSEGLSERVDAEPTPRQGGQHHDDVPLALAGKTRYVCVAGHLTWTLGPPGLARRSRRCETCGLVATQDRIHGGVPVPDRVDNPPLRPGGWYSGKHRRDLYARRSVDELE